MTSYLFVIVQGSILIFELFIASSKRFKILLKSNGIKYDILILLILKSEKLYEKSSSWYTKNLVLKRLALLYAGSY